MNENRTISKSLRKSLPFLRVVSKLSNKNRKKILKDVSGERAVYNALEEIAQNTLNGNLKLNSNQIRRLKPHRKTLENLCNKSNRNCSKKRKKLIVQSGGYLNILLPVITSLLPTLLSKI